MLARVVVFLIAFLFSSGVTEPNILRVSCKTIGRVCGMIVRRSTEAILAFLFVSYQGYWF